MGTKWTERQHKISRNVEREEAKRKAEVSSVIRLGRGIQARQCFVSVGSKHNLAVLLAANSLEPIKWLFDRIVFQSVQSASLSLHLCHTEKSNVWFPLSAAEVRGENRRRVAAWNAARGQPADVLRICTPTMWSDSRSPAGDICGERKSYSLFWRSVPRTNLKTTQHQIKQPTTQTSIKNRVHSVHFIILTVGSQIIICQTMVLHSCQYGLGDTSHRNTPS